jgi:uroporphyrinogen-III synthase
MAAKEKKTLAGRRVVVTRTREQASELSVILAERGAEVVELPVIRISHEVSKENLVDVLMELGSYDWLVFTSPNGVRHFFDEFLRIYDDIRSLGLVRVACVGESTAKAVAAYHIRTEISPEKATAEALANDLVATGSLDSAKVLVITGNLNRDVLVKKLEDARAIVDTLQVYKTEGVDLSNDPAAAEFRAKGADAVLFASSSSAQYFVEQGDALKLARGAVKPLYGSIGPQTSETMRRVGLAVDFEASKPGLSELVDALAKALP